MTSSCNAAQLRHFLVIC